MIRKVKKRERQKNRPWVWHLEPGPFPSQPASYEGIKRPMINDEMKRLARLVSEGDTEAAEELTRLLERAEYGSKGPQNRNVFSFDEEDLFDFKGKRFRAERNNVYRFSCAWWPGSEQRDSEPNFNAPSPRFLGELRHWVPQTKEFIINQGPDFTKVIGSPPKQVAATVVVSWKAPTRNSVIEPFAFDQRLEPGTELEFLPAKMPARYRRFRNTLPDLVESDIQKLSSSHYEVVPWVFGGRLYSKLKELHKEFPLGIHDLRVVCRDEKYQALELYPHPGNLFRKIKEDSSVKAKAIYKDILRKAQILYPNLESFVGKKISLEELQTRLSPPPENLLGDFPAGIFRR